MKFEGRVFKYSDNIDTDVIIPGRYLNSSDPEVLAAHCMEGLDSKFSSKVEKGDVIVAGSNFGSGSSREHAPLSIKASGVSCVIAKSFARIFYRNSINIGLPVFICPSGVENINTGDIVEVDIESGYIKNKNNNKAFQAEKFPLFIQEIIKAGGLIAYTKKHYC